MGHFLDTVELPDLVEGVDARRKTAMQTENLLFDDGRKRKIVEELSELLPDLGISVLAQALIVEAVHLSDLATLVIAAQDGQSLREPDLEGDEQGDSLDRVVAAIDVVSHEEVVGLGRLAANLEQLQQVVELAVDVTANGHRGRDCLHV